MHIIPSSQPTFAIKDVRDAPDLRLLVLHDGLERRRDGPHHVRVGPRRRVDAVHAVEEHAAPARVPACRRQLYKNRSSQENRFSETIFKRIGLREDLFS